MSTRFKIRTDVSILLILNAIIVVGHAQICTVNWNNVHQRIDGFGGGVVFVSPGSLDPVTDANMDTLFKTNNANQLGLSLIRVRISPDSNWSTALSDGKKTVARGAGILATPWTPPASMKSNNNTIGGSLLPAQYTNYAIYLNNFAAYMKTNGAPLRVISVQNEPDFVPTGYEGCGWTATQLQTFCHNVAGLITNAPVMMPESASYNQAMSDPTLNDSVAAANVAVIGEHLYSNGDAGATVVDYPNAHNKGKPTWMTEFLVNDQTIGTAITTAKQIYNCLTIGNMSAYIWWKCLGDANGLVNASGVPEKRGFVMAQWSWFVRPGYYRIDASATAGSAFITAFNDTNSGNFAIVAVNTNASTVVSQSFNLNNFPTVSSVTPWITSAAMSLSNQTPVTVSGSSFSYTLPAMSVVTFVGRAVASLPNTPPVLTPVADQTIDAGQTLLVTNVATDTDSPPQTLTFSLSSGPGALGASSGVYSWRAPVSQADTTNPVTVVVTDSGTPNLSATDSFNVIVNPLSSQPTVDSIGASGGQVTLVLDGPQGPDYTVLTSTNLTDPLSGWQVLLTTNSPVTPVTLVLSIIADPVRFYRIQIGP